MNLLQHGQKENKNNKNVPSSTANQVHMQDDQREPSKPARQDQEADKETRDKETSRYTSIKSIHREDWRWVQRCSKQTRHSPDLVTESDLT